MFTKVQTAAIDGIDAKLVEVEINSSHGMAFSIVGLAGAAVKESRDRVVAAMQNSGYNFPTNNLTLSLTPGDLKKEGTGYDLPIAVAILATTRNVQVESLSHYMLIGELSLNGDLHPVRGVLPTAILARRMKLRGLIVPHGNVQEAAVVNNLDVYGARNLREVLAILNGDEGAIAPTQIDTRREFADNEAKYNCDFNEVKGQVVARRAMEIAAAGGHNIILIGPPGCGKSMLAKRLPTILPPLSMSESLETTQIYSVANEMTTDHGLMRERPFRSPHHSISHVAMVGGGQHNARPGEISLAHNGVLYLDELAEFTRQTLEVLRQPLENRYISIDRTNYKVTYPASFMLAASMNPCPCGYFGTSGDRCRCMPGQVHQYINKLSGPLLDRIDIQVRVSLLSASQMSSPTVSEGSAAIRQRVTQARQLQQQRFQGENGVYCNAQMTPSMLRRYAPLSPELSQVLATNVERNQMSPRAHDRILCIARTIADLAQSKDIQMDHIVEAVAYRILEKPQNRGL